PGAPLSPGHRSCSLVNAPSLTTMAGLVLLPIAGWVTSEAVTVALPEVLSVTLKVLVPLTSAALAGNTALASLELIAIVSLVLTRFQIASTALIVTVNAVPAVCGAGVPVLPLAVPGAAVSPGAKIWSLTNPPTTTGMVGVVDVWIDGLVMSLAVTVALVVSVTLKVVEPLNS